MNVLASNSLPSGVFYRVVSAPRGSGNPPGARRAPGRRTPAECRASMDALRERLEEVRALREVRAELGL